MKLEIRRSIALPLLMALGAGSAHAEGLADEEVRMQSVAETKKKGGGKFLLRQQWFEQTRGMGPKARARMAKQGALAESGFESMNAARRSAIAEQRQHYLKTFATQRAAGEIWQEMGPSSMNMNGWAFGRVSGRLNDIEVHPSDDNTLFVAGASGGVWKTTDGGVNWRSMTDQIGTLPTGDVHIVPGNPNKVWLATGDRNGGGCAGYFGEGVFLSEDGGVSWSAKNGSGASAMPLSITNAVITSPSNDAVVLAGGFGNCDSNGTLNNAGIYRSTDGGNSWSKVVSGKVENIVWGAGNTVYASVQGYGVYKSSDGGATWSNSSSGLSAGSGRVLIAISKSNPSYLYALVGSYLYRSTNGGASWSLRNSRACEGQCTYNLALDVHPSNPETLLVAGTLHFMSTDGGASLRTMTSGWGTGQKVHQDTHVLKFSKNQSNRYWVGTDGGIWRSDNNGSSFANLNANLNLTQFYDIAIHPSNTEKIYGGAQDNSSSARLNGDRIWSLTYASGDGFMNIVDPSNPNTVLQTSYPGGGYPNIVRSTNGGNGGFGSLSRTGLSSGNFPWKTPLAAAGSKVWVASSSLFVGTTSASPFSWSYVGQMNGTASVISPMLFNGSYPTYVGTAGGGIYYSANATSNAGLSNVTGNYPGGNVSDIAMDPKDPKRVFVTRSGFGYKQLYRSTTGGTTWTGVGNGLPKIPANAVLVDPKNSQRIFVGSDAGMYVSQDGGDNFVPFNSGMPLGAVVMDLEIDPTNYVLVAGTWGRGAWKVALQQGTGGGGNQAPSADFRSSINGLTVSFSDASSDTDGQVVSRAWNFGDGSSSSAANPSKTYGKAGSYTVTLTVTDNLGATATTSRSLTVSDGGSGNKAPSASFSAAPRGLEVSFFDSSSDSDGQIVSRQWNFGDNSSSSQTNPVKTYANAGSYTVTLTVTDNAGAVAKTSQTVTVTRDDDGGNGEGLVASFKHSAQGLTVSFTDTSTDSTGTIARRRWEFGDGTTSTERNPTKTYSAAGSYFVLLSIKNSVGEIAEGNQRITVSATDDGGDNGGTPTGTLAEGDFDLKPGAKGQAQSWYQSSASGTHSARLSGPATTNFDLYLQKWDGSTWNSVARAETSSSSETISYSGSTGYYRYYIYARSGSGAYTLTFTKP